MVRLPLQRFDHRLHVVVLGAELLDLRRCEVERGDALRVGADDRLAHALREVEVEAVVAELEVVRGSA